MLQRRAIVGAVGYVAFAYIALMEIERLLGLARPGRDGGPAGFSPDVLTRPNVGSFPDVLWSAADVKAVFGALGGLDRDLVLNLLGSYLAIDLVLAIAISFLLWSLLVHFGRSPLPAIIYGIADVLETVIPLALLRTDLLANPVTLNIVSFLSSVKWGALIAAAGLILLTWWRSLRSAPAPATEAAQPNQPWLRVLPQFLIVGAFLLLMAVPGPNAMTQLPDVLRASFEGATGDGSLAARIAFAVAPFVLVLAVVVAVRAATSTPQQYWSVPPFVAWLWPVGVGLLAGAVAFFGVLGATHDARLAAWAWFFIPAGIVVLGGLARRLVPLGSSSAAATVRVFRASTRRWLAIGLAGAILVGASLALVRAALPPALLGVPDVDTPYGLLVVIGLLGAVLSPLLMEFLAIPFGRISRHRSTMWLLLELLVVCVLLVASLKLGLDPIVVAPAIGTPGVIAVAFGTAVVGTALLTALSLRSPSAEALRQLRVNNGRPSWIIYVVAVWLLSSMLGGPTGYHDANTAQSPNEASPTLKAAILGWLTEHATANSDCVSKTSTDHEVVPLVFVAAPGGGIRAAYWTAAALDGMFTTPSGARCPQSLFAVAGASGGSVGATVRLLTDPSLPALPAVRAMARDRALAANVAAMFYRDFPQSWFPAINLWDDRAAVHESAWVRDAPIFKNKTASDIGAAWVRDPDAEDEFSPGVLLGSSSINDGCRAFTSSWTAVVNEGNGCTDRGADPAPLTAAHDVRAGLPGNGEQKSDLPAVTAALLSARFPWVSPTGAIHGNGAPKVLYLADGGIYENTALLGLLQTWDAIAQEVADHNRTVLADSSDAKRPLVEPWLVFLNNGFEAEQLPPNVARPRELSAPIAAALQRIGQATVGENALLQSADQRFSGNLPGTTYDAEHPMRVVVLRPTENDPGLTAPLGWVLAPSTQNTLGCELLESFEGTEAKSLLVRLAAGSDQPGSAVQITPMPDCSD